MRVCIGRRRLSISTGDQFGRSSVSLSRWWWSIDGEEFWSWLRWICLRCEFYGVIITRSENRIHDWWFVSVHKRFDVRYNCSQFGCETIPVTAAGVRMWCEHIEQFWQGARQESCVQWSSSMFETKPSLSEHRFTLGMRLFMKNDFRINAPENRKTVQTGWTRTQWVLIGDFTADMATSGLLASEMKRSAWSYGLTADLCWTGNGMTWWLTTNDLAQQRSIRSAYSSSGYYGE